MALHTYTPYEWKNAPDHKTTPLSADNLNHIEQGIKNAYSDIANLAQRGVVELWTNPSPTSNFAGQTINITQTDLDNRGLNVNINDIDAVDIEFSVSGTYDMTTIRVRIGNSCQPTVPGTDGSSLILAIRIGQVTRNNNTISINFTDSTTYQIIPSGSPITANNWNIPVIITGLIHNS